MNIKKTALSFCDKSFCTTRKPLSAKVAQHLKNIEILCTQDRKMKLLCAGNFAEGKARLTKAKDAYTDVRKRA